jgi:hypothetical protein
MSERQRLYRAGIHWDDRGANLFVHYGHVSPCGEWVDSGRDHRSRRTADWFETEAEARASKAADIAAMGAKLLQQAAELVSPQEVTA